MKRHRWTRVDTSAPIDVCVHCGTERREVVKRRDFRNGEVELRKVQEWRVMGVKYWTGTKPVCLPI